MNSTATPTVIDLSTVPSEGPLTFDDFLDELEHQNYFTERHIFAVEAGQTLKRLVVRLNLKDFRDMQDWDGAFPADVINILRHAADMDHGCEWRSRLFATGIGTWAQVSADPSNVQSWVVSCFDGNHDVGISRIRVETAPSLARANALATALVELDREALIAAVITG